ncbi:MAG: hypothetical protein ACUVUH_02635 [bacterium]
MVDYWADEPWQNMIEQKCLRVFMSFVLQYLRLKIVVDCGFGKVEFF